MPRNSDLKVAKGEVLKLYPISGTGAQHVNPINGRCLYGKDKRTGECRLYPYPRYTMEGKLNLPPPRGPPDDNGYRSSPPVKFPKALMSVAGEIERKSGDLDFQEKVKQEMQQNEAIMEALQKHILKQESTISEQEADLQMLQDEVKLAKDRVSTELENFKDDIKDKIKKKASQVGPEGPEGQVMLVILALLVVQAFQALQDHQGLRERWEATEIAGHQDDKAGRVLRVLRAPRATGRWIRLVASVDAKKN
ncbi:hypothetical protein GUITHDRAFT_110928 [Guillardia theta CCMP2712]|uniref:Uncharacterized protein n=1 Tax=Guillardia theta (strain CCMP2712) TaxID=905079 RepID=L1J3U6_GUITC|nr:hypothetical protein GUITHDRAFT_110928 [Guillardia theta CCMP2712]EKX43203.1 hypothetical protein GUITHDRAFT_110928 [Guillardia theta CCMP2712]|eukprot:XP_005830183.1 hypothetical protein GUITHDRAFT_110928 [Guillardia theta CCMP2712]